MGHASGSVQGVPAALTPGMQIISGYFIGEDVTNHGVDFSHNDLRGVTFDQSSYFQYADFTGCIFGHIHGGNFAHADFTGATFVGHIDPSVVLTNANFTAAVLRTWWAQMGSLIVALTMQGWATKLNRRNARKPTCSLNMLRSWSLLKYSTTLVPPLILV